MQRPTATSDKVSKTTRGWIMSRVRSKRTSPEVATGKALHAAGFRFRLHRKDLPGKPDIVLPKYRVAVMVHGCLWHGHQCNRFRWPVANAEYWRTKIERNMARDNANVKSLGEAGWTVKVVWDCQLKDGLTALLSDLDRMKRWRTFSSRLEGIREQNLAHRIEAGLPPITQEDIRSFIKEGRR